MRGIKFRIWHKKDGMKYFGEHDYHITFDGKVYSQSDIEPIVNLLDCGFELMLYTTLPDKNKVEIYEGDIVRVRSFNRYTADGKLDRNTPLNYNEFGVVEWCSYNCSFMIMQRQYKDRVVDQWNNSIDLQPSREDSLEMEVIGNIYEHKELLK